jgi:hypothetical protein
MPLCLALLFIPIPPNSIKIFEFGEKSRKLRDMLFVAYSPSLRKKNIASYLKMEFVSQGINVVWKS